MSDDYFNDESSASPPASDFFQSGSPSCRFNTIGDTHKGVVASFEEAQQRDIVDGKPKFWPDGNPRQMLVINLETSERDAEIDDDDGSRRLYVNKPSGMFAAIKVALGKNKLLVGGTLAVKYIKDGQAKQAGFNKPKEYVAHYVPPNGAPAQSTTATTKTNGDVWTFDRAIAECIKVGIDKPGLIQRLKLLGLKTWNDVRDTPTVKHFIEEESVSQVFNAIPSANEEVPF